MPSNNDNNDKEKHRRRLFRNEDNSHQPEERDTSKNASNRRVDPDSVLICIEALRGKTIRIKPTYVMPANPQDRKTTHEFEVQTERGVETSRLRV